MKFTLPKSDCPKIRMIPMLTVMMGILAYFVLLSFSQPAFQTITLTLPPIEQEPSLDEDGSTLLPLIIQMTDSGLLVWQEEKLSIAMAKDKIVDYLTNNPHGTVYLAPHPGQTYRQVLESWQSIQDIENPSLHSDAKKRILLTWNHGNTP